MDNQSNHHGSRQILGHQASAHAGDNWLTVSEVAARLRVSRDTVERWIHTGQLLAVNVGTDPILAHRRARWRVNPKSLEGFLNTRFSRPPLPARRKFRQRNSDLIEFIK
jgi:excisionase family DNA binding protein